ncbi:Kei1p Ecym_4762 [Eremothecium cymbalariae DBVPG|uniref:DUF1753 domain-containing protein n=1 Tax=Eremothecium cymbalariae (strain CBS 270.75 / DBVPG 7215 / KCTC 17166 / NRRL Y-17582) TaxID=931890 RepID=G8JSQ2_ERECY|nr:hypothetical protein Ecym_4762 [Eremothecium cymbalariae DBVPG\
MVYLPQSFFGLPLYIGVELSLGVAIFNKFCGLYGILALFTGRPLDLIQWGFYVWSFAALLVFTKGLSQVYKPKLMTYCMVLTVYSLDTVLACFFAVLFTGDWFSKEDTSSGSNPVSGKGIGVVDVGKSGTQNFAYRRTVDDTQSASTHYEYSSTILLTLIVSALRFYSNFIIASFVRRMMKQNRYITEPDDVEYDLKNTSVAYRAYVSTQRWCYYFCRRYL